MFESWKEWLDDDYKGMGLKIRDDAPPQVKEEFRVWSENQKKRHEMGYR